MRVKLRKAIDETIQNSDKFSDFIATMQSKEYTIKIGKHISFKNDDKVIVKSKRKILRAELDASLKKAKSHEEFLNDMCRKNFEVKEGKHLAFKGENQERFIRSESLGYHYTEEVLRFRFECEEEYKTMADNRIGRVIDWTDFDGTMYNWACGENDNIENRSTS